MPKVPAFRRQRNDYEIESALPAGWDPVSKHQGKDNK